MFVGCNNQLQNVIFAQALIRDERADTFEWGFSKFRECMGYKDPITIFTDQDNAMENAIRKLFLQTIHRFLDVLCHTKESEARERFNSEREILTSTYYGYEAQLGKLYTRKVYNKFKEELKSGTAFSTREEPGNVGYYLVQHRKVDTNFPWLDHAFCIKAIYNIIDPEQSEFKCECMTWEHTGLFCCHLICAFTHLCVERVPSKYIMKRYTKTPFVDTAFDRHDKVFMGPDGDTKARCTASIMADLFKLQRSAVMPGQALEKEKLIIRDALPILDAIPHDLGLPTRDNPSSPNMSHVKQEEINMSASTPPVSTTKGTRRTGAKTEERPPPHFQRDRRKQRRCLRCGLCDTGHNAATCERNKKERANNISKRPRGRPRGSSRRRGNMRGGCTSVSESNNMQGDKWQSNGWCDDASSSRWRKSWDRNIA
ncbi:hypothetical protein QOZ80_2BG0178640 [Eleusine coracana subsp. coracana]|nr:hypothetical protein QOZ80_2BG0178640 [Eleusine coracana subsp. coracana]